MADVPRPAEQLPFKEIDEVFTCDCGSQTCAMMIVTIMDDQLAMVECADQDLINIPWHWLLWRSLKIFWRAFWHHEHSVEVIVNRKQHRQLKALFSTLKDERCHLCEPDYMEGRGRYWKHGH